MRANSPHYLLFSEAFRSAARWRFVLQPVGSDDHLAVADSEPGASASRLELLAVVRGLEALEQPSRVTLLTSSRYVCRGVRNGLSQWRDNNWRWECFGKSVPIRDCDLWKRMERAMQIHTVDCCAWQAEERDDDTSVSEHTRLAQAKSPAKSEPKLVAAVAAEPLSVPAAFEAEEPAAEPALLIVPRQTRRQPTADHPANWSLVEALNQLGSRVLGPISAICRPAFTRAA
jgi:ribonuclease HI